MSARPSGGRPLEDASLADRDIQECPYEYYRHLRETAPVYYDEGLGFWICTTYELVKEVLRDTETYSNVDSQAVEQIKPKPPEVAAIKKRGWAQVDTLVTNDPPAHTRVREMVDEPFSPRRVAELRPYVEEIVADLIDGFIDDGELEVVRQFAIPLPIRVIADQLGVPREDAGKFRRWSDATLDQLSLMIDDAREIECAREILEMQRYFAAAFEERRERPREDLLTALLNARREGEEPFSMEELLSITQQLLVAGNETTTNAIAAGFRLLIEHPEDASRLAAEPRRIKTFVEEVLRLESPTQGLFRIVKKDTELGGVALPAGARLMIRFAAANRDEQKYADAETLDICRRNAGTHMAFGAGIHRCLGAPLARLEMVCAFEAVLARMENLRYADGRNDFEHFPSLLMRGLKSLHIEFDRRGN